MSSNVFAIDDGRSHINVHANNERVDEDRDWPLDDYKIPDNPLFVMTALYQEDVGGVRVLGI